MKKKLLIASCLSAWFAAKSQLTYVGNSALVHVEDQALVYSGGGIKLDGNARVNTIGDIMMVTSSENFEVANTADFRLKFVSPSVYGQFYIQDTPQGNITGRVNKEYVSAAHGTTGRQQVALPFHNYTPADLRIVLPQINLENTALTSTGRRNPRSVFKWDNATSQFLQIALPQSTVGKPTDYYILSRRNFDGTIAWDPTVTTENELSSTDNLAGTGTAAAATAVNTKKKIFQGVPVSDVSGDTTVSLSGAISTPGFFGTGGTRVNSFNERYNSYLNDPFVTNPWTGDYGLNVYQHGNPFLTNIDLSLIKTGTTSTDDENAIANLNGIFYYTSGIENNPSGTTYAGTTSKKITFDVNNLPVAGSANDLVIMPMQNFVMKLANNTAQTLKFNKTRRFAQVARDASVPYAVTAARVATSEPVVTKQLGVLLLDANDVEIDRTFFVLNSAAVTGYAPDNARMQAVSESTAIFTQEEKLTGGADTNTTYRLYINEANEVDFEGKKVPLVVNHPNAAKLKFILLENAQYLPDAHHLSNGKAFYFENNGVMTKLSSGTTMPINSSSATFGVYYNPPGGTLATKELSRSETVIAKRDADYVVRFSKNWKTADVEIYSASGQLVFTAKKVSTTSDFVLPLSSSVNTLYIVKLISENGEIVTKKVIK